MSQQSTVLPISYGLLMLTSISKDLNLFAIFFDAAFILPHNQRIEYTRHKEGMVTSNVST